MLALTKGEKCDKPLRAFLFFNVVRLGVQLPLSTYSYLTPPRPPRSQPDGSQISERRWGSTRGDRWAKRIHDFSTLSAVAVFLLGNISYFSSKTCKADSPRLWYSALAALILSYLWIAEVLLMVVAIFLFLPVFLVGVRLFGLGESTPSIKPLSSREIEKLPLRVFWDIIPSASDSPTASSPAPTTTTTPPPPPVKKSRWNWSKLLKPKSSPSTSSSAREGTGGRRKLPEGMEWISLMENQSSCAICLSEYEPPPLLLPSTTTGVEGGEGEGGEWSPDTLKLLPCSHVFHAGCIDGWLVVSGRCPICQRGVLGGERGGKGGGGEV